MTIGRALYEELKNDAGVSALVSTRIYPNFAPADAARPYLVYQRISTPRERSHSGPSGLAHPRFQITAAADTYPALRSLANAVRAALDGFSGSLGDVAVRTDVFMVNEVEDYIEEIPTHIARLDFILWHKET